MTLKSPLSIFPSFIPSTPSRLTAHFPSHHFCQSRHHAAPNLRTSAFRVHIPRPTRSLSVTRFNVFLASSTPPSDPTPSAVDTDSEDADDQTRNVVLGPSQAPTQAGVSTLGLSEQDASFISACYDADITAIEKALSDGQDVNIVDVNRRTALHFCAANGLPTLCKRLLEMGAEIDAQDVKGLTALHMATGYRKLDTVRLLIEGGADANLTSVEGELAVEIAEGILEKTPRKKWFGENQMWRRMKDIVDILDEATELEDEDEEDNGDEATAEEITEETENAKFVVRVKPKGEKAAQPVVIPDDTEVKVTVRVKTREP
eukprot:GFKZ01009452.1.p1 GENE.GFKZ01009452.1~~GFKZ01009452.1.p1  ORF type:complete len:317 (+),score=55.75 GFKZ01009452.1:100-1050(+)